MSEFVAQKFNANDINNGKKYKNGDGVSADTINKVIEASLYAQQIEFDGSELEEKINQNINEFKQTTEDRLNEIEENVGSDVSEKIDQIDERLGFLESFSLEFVEETETSYKKIITENEEVGKSILIKSIGGATQRNSDTNTFLNAKVTNLYSLCANLIPFPYRVGNTIKGAGYTETVNGVTFKVNADGSISANGVPTSEYSDFVFADISNVDFGNGYYSVSGAPLEYTDEPIDTTIMLTYPSVSVRLINTKTSAFYDVIDHGEVSISPPAQSGNYDKIRAYVRINKKMPATNFVFKPMFTNTKSKISYKAYSEYPLDTFAIPSDVTEISGYGEGINDIYYNEIRWINDKVVFIEKCKKLLLDGTEEWTKYSGVDGGLSYFACSNIGLQDAISGFCLSDQYDTININSSNKNVGIYFAYSSLSGKNTINIRPQNVANMTIPTFQSNLSKKPITLLYAVQNPKIIDITDKFSSYNSILIENGGFIKFENENKMAVPNTIQYVVKKEQS